MTGFHGYHLQVGGFWRSFSSRMVRMSWASWTFWPKVLRAAAILCSFALIWAYRARGILACSSWILTGTLTGTMMRAILVIALRLILVGLDDLLRDCDLEFGGLDDLSEVRGIDE